MKLSGPILLFLRVADLYICIWFRIAPKLSINVLLGTPFIDGISCLIWGTEYNIVGLHSPLITPLTRICQKKIQLCKKSTFLLLSMISPVSQSISSAYMSHPWSYLSRNCNAGNQSPQKRLNFVKHPSFTVSSTIRTLSKRHNEGIAVSAVAHLERQLCNQESSSVNAIEICSWT